MTEKQLARLFKQVVRQGTILGTSQRLGQPYSTIYQRIGAFEDLYGGRLLKRQTGRTVGGVTPTAKGRRVLERI